MEQFERLKNLDSFASGKIQVLIASDVAARGLDIPQVEAVVEYEPATSAETRTHRVGRTGRAGRPGVAFILETSK
jgi:superfamily II DNA/RNA helicase